MWGEWAEERDKESWDIIKAPLLYMMGMLKHIPFGKGGEDQHTQLLSHIAAYGEGKGGEGEARREDRESKKKFAPPPDANNS